ncbi:MAG: hypothetical protein IJ593_05285 [Lachnospiraceae bacterium]|nr:hypothetical protein [Lachnospiraceae bacterium]
MKDNKNNQNNPEVKVYNINFVSVVVYTVILFIAITGMITITVLVGTEISSNNNRVETFENSYFVYNKDENCFITNITSYYNGDTFRIRKICNQYGYGKYEVFCLTKSGDYRIFNVSEDNIQLNITNSKIEPYIKIYRITDKFDKILRADIYLPPEYYVDVVYDTSYSVNVAVKEGSSDAV